MNPGDLVGEWVVLREGPRYPFPKRDGCRPRRFECRCSCGKVKLVALSNLKIGRTRSCGHGRLDWKNLKETHHAPLSELKPGRLASRASALDGHSSGLSSNK